MQVAAASQCGRCRGPSKDGVSLSFAFAFEFSALAICSGKNCRSIRPEGQCKIPGQDLRKPLKPNE